MGCLHVKEIDKVRYTLAAAFLLITGLASASEPYRGTLFLHRDARGDVTLATNGSGSPVQSSRYGPWGNLARTSGNGGVQPSFTGQELDSGTGLHYFSARYYDARFGRFLSPDPLRQFHSPYLYAFDAPLEYVDPTGKGATVFIYTGRPLTDAARANAPRLLIGDPHGMYIHGKIKYRLSYYYEGSVVVERKSGAYVLTPTQLSTNPDYNMRRFENVRTAFTKWQEVRKRNYFTVEKYEDWIRKQSNHSVVIVYMDHGETFSTGRIQQFEKLVKGHSKTFIGCVDTGCGQFSTAHGELRIVKAYNDIGIPYFASSGNVQSPQFESYNRMWFSGQRYELGSRNRPEYTIEVWNGYSDNSQELLKHFDEVDNGQWMLSVPDGARNRIIMDHSAPYKRGEPRRVKEFRFR